MVLDIEITRADYADYNKSHYLRSKLYRRLFIYLAVIMVIYLAISVRTVHDIIQVVIPLVLCSVFYFGLLYFLLSRTGKVPKENGSILGKRRLEFTNESIKLNSSDADSQMRWKNSMKLVKGKTALYLYVDTVMAIVIPLRYFASKEEEEKCTSFIEERIKEATI